MAQCVQLTVTEVSWCGEKRAKLSVGSWIEFPSKGSHKVSRCRQRHLERRLSIIKAQRGLHRKGTTHWSLGRKEMKDGSWDSRRLLSALGHRLWPAFLRANQRLASCSPSTLRAAEHDARHFCRCAYTCTHNQPCVRSSVIKNNSSVLGFTCKWSFPGIPSMLPYDLVHLTNSLSDLLPILKCLPLTFILPCCLLCTYM